jgi:hypothetical protein
MFSACPEGPPGVHHVNRGLASFLPPPSSCGHGSSFSVEGRASSDPCLPCGLLIPSSPQVGPGTGTLEQKAPFPQNSPGTAAGIREALGDMVK